MQVLPIFDTKVDWQTLLKTAKQCLGRSLTDKLDSANISVDGLASLIAVLGSLKDGSKKPIDILKEPGELLHQSFYGFLVVCTTDALFELLEETSLKVVSTETLQRNYRLACISGTLAEWRTAIIAGTSKTAGYETRTLIDACLLHFERIGLSNLWHKFAKKQIEDTSFTLIPK